MDEVQCRRCETPVDVWGLGKSFLFWFLGGGIVTAVGAITLVIGIGFVILPVGVLMTVGAPLGMFLTKGMRHCEGCKLKWPPRQDKKKALLG